jgi:hypothetical protein
MLSLVLEGPLEEGPGAVVVLVARHLDPRVPPLHSVVFELFLTLALDEPSIVPQFITEIEIRVQDNAPFCGC